MNTSTAWIYAADELNQIMLDAQSEDGQLADRAKTVGKIWDKMSFGGVTTKLLDEMATAVNAYQEYRNAQANR